MRTQRHQRLGDLVGTPLLFGHPVRIMVNQRGDEVQLVHFGPDYRAMAETVPPEDATDVDGWTRAAERVFGLSGYVWAFERRGARSEE